jgi:Winged helix DNA-binding domain
MLKRLQALGLVNRSRSAADERTTHVELTPKAAIYAGVSPRRGSGAAGRPAARALPIIDP